MGLELHVWCTLCFPGPRTLTHHSSQDALLYPFDQVAQIVFKNITCELVQFRISKFISHLISTKITMNYDIREGDIIEISLVTWSGMRI